MKFHPSKDNIINFPVKQGAILPGTCSLEDSYSRLILLPDRKRLRLLTPEPVGVVVSLTFQDLVKQFVPFTSIIGTDERWQVNLSIKQPQELPQELVVDPLENIEVFFCYSRSSKDNSLRVELEKHLRIMKRQMKERHNLIITLRNGEVGAGKAWQQEIERHLANADIILLLVSPDFLDSDFCTNIEMEQALNRHNEGEACVIPVILRPCNWEDEDFGELQALPDGDKPVTEWTIRDKAFKRIAHGVQGAILELIESSRTQEMP